jgi:pimeloyl-ACP methyl ester carboxylesterase
VNGSSHGRATTSEDAPPGAPGTTAPAAAPALLAAQGAIERPGLWRHQQDYLGDRFRFREWPTLAGTSGALPRDLEALMAAAGPHPAVALGHGLGVRSVLAAARYLGRRLAGLVLVAGTPYPTFGAARAAIAGVASRHLATPLWRVFRRAAGGARSRRALVATMRRIELLPDPRDGSDDDGVIEALVALPASRLLAPLAACADDGGSAMLDSIGLPTLVIAGERDPLVPVARVQQMARHLRRSQVLVIAGSGHYPNLERPDLVNLRLERFLQDLGLW